MSASAAIIKLFYIYYAQDIISVNTFKKNNIQEW